MLKGKVLYVGGFELPDKNAAAHRVMGNAKALRRIGYEVEFLGISKSQSPGTFAISDQYQGFNFSFVQYPQTKLEWFRYITSIKKIKETISKKKYDIIILYNFPAIASYRLLKYCRKKEIRIISDCTEWYKYELNNIVDLVRKLDTELRMRYINKKMDGIICISEYLFNYYEKIPTKVVVPPLVDLQDKKWKGSDIIEGDRLELIYAGSPGRNKDKIDLVLDSLTKIINNSIHVNIIGLTEKEYLEKYPEHRYKIEEINKFTTFYGSLPHRRALDLIKKSDFTIFLREKNKQNMAGFPTKFSESISSGTPVLTNKTSDLKEYLQEGVNGFWLDMDSEKMRIQQLEKVKNMTKIEINKMKRQAKQSKMFDYRDFISEFEKLINNIYMD